MSVDTLRETFHINRISTNDLGGFLTAQTYRPEITGAINKVRSLRYVKLQSVCDTPIRQGKSPKYIDGAGLKCIKPKNTRNLIVDLSSCDSIDVSTIDDIRRQKLEYGDIVITRSGSGTIGRASIYTGEEDVYTNDHLFIVRASDADSFYVVSFLKSYWGERLLEAGISGSTGQLNLSNEHIKQVSLYAPDALAQRYIGNKVRHAERLRAWAKGLEIQFSEMLELHLDDAFEDQSTGRKHSFAKKEEISYTLNPGAFDEERLRVQRHMLAAGGVKLGNIATISGQSTSIYDDNRVYIGLNAIDTNSCQLSPTTAGDADVTGSSRVLPEGPVIAKLRPYLNKASYIPPSLAGAIGSTELMCVQPKGDVSGWYLYGVLKSEVSLKQLRPVATGATHPRIDQYDVLNLVVPVLENNQELGQLLELAQQAYFSAKRCTTASKLLVEALIEGQLTEQQLIFAQQALDTGDTSPDRDILSRLTNKGLDGDGEPLFPDLDQLYELLAQSQKTEE
jgi:type I restriction enzyme S subunit